jgi:hypothetical protein
VPPPRGREVFIYIYIGNSFGNGLTYPRGAHGAYRGGGGALQTEKLRSDWKLVVGGLPSGEPHEKVISRRKASAAIRAGNAIVATERPTGNQWRRSRAPEAGTFPAKGKKGKFC